MGLCVVLKRTIILLVLANMPASDKCKGTLSRLVQSLVMRRWVSSSLVMPSFRTVLRLCKETKVPKRT